MNDGKPTKFYTFRQNNSGGYWNGPKYVIIEAFNAEHANELAGNNDIYFHGCATGTDCECCGDRWYEVSEYEAEDEPLIDKEPLENYNREDYKLIKLNESFVVKLLFALMSTTLL